MGFGTYMDFAHMLADEAGDIACRYFKTDLRVETKADASPVSIADKEIEQAIRQRISAQFPDHGVLGEEFANDGVGRDYVWVIDPIDGTRAFLAGNPTFTTLIALCYHGVPVLGIIDQPVVMERYSGLEGKQSLLNGQPINARACSDIKNARLATTGMEYFTPEQRPRFEAVATLCGGLSLGGDAYNYAKLAAGEIDLVIEAGLKPYDAMALRPVIEGAGGIVTDWNGDALKLDSRMNVLAAGSRPIHDAARAQLS